MLRVSRMRVLVEVAKLGSFSAAAEALSFTQPSVSRQIAALESEAGTRLLERDANGVRLTQAGEIVLKHATPILARLAAAEAELRALADLEGGRVRLSAFGTANGWLVPTALHRFAQLHPRVELALVRADDGLAAVRSGEVDLALTTSWDLHGPDDGAGTELVPLLDDELFLAVSRTHPLAASGRLAVSALADESWIEGAHPDCLGPFEELWRLLGAPPRIAFHCDDWTGKQALVAAGVGVMLYPRLALPDARGDLVLRRLPRSLPPRRVFAAVPAGYRAPAVDEMLTCLRDVVATLPATPGCVPPGVC